MAKLTKKAQQEREEAITRLREILKPGDTVNCNLRHVSRSGMLRIIDLSVVLDGEIVGIGTDADLVLRWGFDRDRWGIKAGGCGMDMGFQTVYALSTYLFPNGFGIEGITPDGAKVRPASKLEASEMAKDGVKFRGRNGDIYGWDDCGGYALKYRWL